MFSMQKLLQYHVSKPQRYAVMVATPLVAIAFTHATYWAFDKYNRR